MQNGFYWDIENEEQKVTGKTRNLQKLSERTRSLRPRCDAFRAGFKPCGFKFPANKGVMG